MDQQAVCEKEMFLGEEQHVQSLCGESVVCPRVRSRVQRAEGR